MYRAGIKIVESSNRLVAALKRHPNRTNSFVGGMVALAAFVLYFRTLAPTMLYYDPEGMYDSVMLQAKAYLLSIPNPTGYPTYMMITHLFTYLPLGDVGYRVNLASSIFAMLAVFVVFCVCRVLTGRTVPAIAAAFLFGVSREFWSQAVITEVYTLNALLISLDILVLLTWYRRREDRYLLIFAFLMGLTMTNHMTSGMMLPAAAIFIALVDRSRLTEWRLIAKGAGLYFVGLLPYLYLPIRSAMKPPLDEAEPYNVSNFFALITGSNFEGRMFAIPMSDMPERIGMYADFLANQFNPLLLIPAIFGALYLSYKHEIPLLGFFGFLYFGWLFYALGYDISDVYVYFIPTYLIVCLLIAVAFSGFMDFAERHFEGLPSRLRKPAVAYTLTVVLAVLFLALPLSGVRTAYAQVDRSDDMHGRHIMDAVMRGVAPDSTVMHNGGVMWYMKYVTDHRQDLEIVDPFPSGGWQARSPLWVEKAENQLGQGRRVYIIFPGKTAEVNLELFNSAGYDLIEDESGMFYEVVERERTRMDGTTSFVSDTEAPRPGL